MHTMFEQAPVSGLASSNLPDGKPILVMWYQFPSASTLHLASLELHGVVVLRLKLSFIHEKINKKEEIFIYRRKYY